MQYRKSYQTIEQQQRAEEGRKAKAVKLLLLSSERKIRSVERLRDVGATDNELWQWIRKTLGAKVDYSVEGLVFLYREKGGRPILYLDVANHWGANDGIHLNKVKATLYGDSFVNYARKLLAIPYPTGKERQLAIFAPITDTELTPNDPFG